jgi:hypothetical protein
MKKSKEEFVLERETKKELRKKELVSEREREREIRKFSFTSCPHSVSS